MSTNALHAHCVAPALNRLALDAHSRNEASRKLAMQCLYFALCGMRQNAVSISDDVCAANTRKLWGPKSGGCKRFPWHRTPDRGRKRHAPLRGFVQLGRDDVPSSLHALWSRGLKLLLFSISPLSMGCDDPRVRPRPFRIWTGRRKRLEYVAATTSDNDGGGW